MGEGIYLVSVFGSRVEWARAHFFVYGMWCLRTGLDGSVDRLVRNRMALDLDRIRDAAERAARSAGVELVDIEWKMGRQRFLRVFIDKPFDPAAHAKGEPPPGVSHSDCQAVSEQLSVLLDVEDLVPGDARYVLEVSSPGLDRKLTRPAEFERFAGRKAKISLSEPVGDQSYFEGRLAGYADGRIKMDVQGRIVELPLAAVRKAQLVVEL
jgi:ribosome maturation factor RimP